MTEFQRPPAPPIDAIRAACYGAGKSPCAKSKRGAVLFEPKTQRIFSPGWNSRPDNKCDELCQPRAVDNLNGNIALVSPPSRCSMLCIHAEARAVRWANAASARSQYVADGEFAFNLWDLELVHAKIEVGHLVPSGGPSCWQCAKELAEVGIAGVWLYETIHVDSIDGRTDKWVFYPIKEFYEITLRACRLG